MVATVISEFKSVFRLKILSRDFFSPGFNQMAALDGIELLRLGAQSGLVCFTMSSLFLHEIITYLVGLLSFSTTESQNFSQQV